MKIYYKPRLSGLCTIQGAKHRKWEVMSALMSMPPTNDYEWTIASRFSKVDELYRDLQLGPYQYLRDWSPAGILKRFKTEILLPVFSNDLVVNLI